MDTEKCRALITAIDTGSITAAAVQLQFTPSGISRMIAALEEWCGFQLLYRKKEGVSVTPECQQILPMLRRMVRDEEELKQCCDGVNGLTTGNVVVATVYDSFYPFLSEVISGFRDLHPGVQVTVANGSYSSQLMHRIEAHELDLCIISFREGKCRWYPLLEDPLVALIPKGHPLAAREQIPVSVYGREDYVETFPGTDVDNNRAFRRCKVKPATKYTTMDLSATCSMVAAGMGIAMTNGISSMHLRDRMQVLPLEPSQSVEIGIAAARELSPAAEAFLGYVRTRWKQR